MIYVENKDLVIPGEVLADDDYYSGRGTFKENGKICSSLMGLVSLRNKKIRVIPLKSKYIPKKGDVVIGKIDDVKFSMWDVDINSPYSGILPAFEVFGREKKELSKVFDVGDILFLRVIDVDEVKKAKLGLKGRGMGKFKGGIIVEIAPTKVPRLIGKKGSMINMIKDKTGCKIVVGQNGLVWVRGDEDMEQLTKEIIHTIEKEAHTSGLTNKIKNKLYLEIDGELPEEEQEPNPDDYDEDGLEKPKLQDFREELEEEEKEVCVPKSREANEDKFVYSKLETVEKDIIKKGKKIKDNVSDKVDENVKEGKKVYDKLDFYKRLEELKKKNKSRAITIGNKPKNSLILNDKDY